MNQFEKDLSCFQIELTEIQKKQFQDYFELLVDRNKVVNLTSITEYDQVCKKHFVDSLSIVKALPQIGKSKMNLLDVGTGAGFPGIPINIIYNNVSVTLLDSLNKRINFLKDVIDKCQLTGIEAIHGRAEDFAREAGYREQFDVVVSRAVANLSTLSEYCIPYVKPGGVFISYKADIKEDELEGAKSAIKKLGGAVQNVIEFELPESDISRKLVIIKKEKKTSSLYPRKAGLPSKNPLS